MNDHRAANHRKETLPAQERRFLRVPETTPPRAQMDRRRANEPFHAESAARLP
ncbi:MAG: hypothetical protein JJU00_07015 [Opitutales bacterium]|nr:hypothetical protein [Opitutales bacterium]